MKRFLFASVLLCMMALAMGMIVVAQEAEAPASAEANVESSVKLESPSLDDVIEKLFGAPDGGLLDGDTSFQLLAEDLNLTAEQSAQFFTTASEENLAALVKATQSLHSVVQFDGTIEGEPFHLKIAGRQLKLDGITLTAEQRDALTAELRGIDGLHEMKIEGTVDGRASVIKIQGGVAKIERLEPRENEILRERSVIEARANARVERPARVEIERPVKADLRPSIDLPLRIERPARPERPETGRR